jgi:hypothetical protein
MPKAQFLIVSLGLLIMIGCFAAGPLPNYPDDAIVLQLGPAGGNTIVAKVDPSEIGVSSIRDVFHYIVCLKGSNQKNGEGRSTNVEMISVAEVSVPNDKTSDVKTVVFANIEPGRIYRVELEAEGNDGGTAPTKKLTDSPIRAMVDFTDPAGANIKEVRIVVNILPPAEGEYQNPQQPETGIAE